MLVIWIPLSSSPLDYIDTISDSLTRLHLYTLPVSSSSKSTTRLPPSFSSTTSSSSESSPLASSLAHLPPPDTSCELTTANSTAKCGTKFSHLLRKNETLKTLLLRIPLNEDDFWKILDSLSHSKSLTKLRLSKNFHSQYIRASEAQRLDNRIEML